MSVYIASFFVAFVPVQVTVRAKQERRNPLYKIAAATLLDLSVLFLVSHFKQKQKTHKK